MSADFLAIGHVARDEFEGEATWRLGGTALYAAATAARLGTPTALVTRVGPIEKPALEERCMQLGIALHALPSSVTTTFAFRYVDGRRFLRLKARARGIAPSTFAECARAGRGSARWRTSWTVPSSYDLGGGQRPRCAGYLREWAADGAIQPRRWEDANEIVPSCPRSCERGRRRRRSERTTALARSGCVRHACRARRLVLDRGTEVTIPAIRRSASSIRLRRRCVRAVWRSRSRTAGRPTTVPLRNAVASFAGRASDGKLADRARVDARMR